MGYQLTYFSLFSRPKKNNSRCVTYIVEVEEGCIGSACLDKTRFKALVDSGSSFTFLPKEAYDRMVVEFDRQVDATRASYEEPWKYCYNSSSTEMPKTPPGVALKLGLNNSLVIRNPVIEVYADERTIGFCLAIQPTDEDIENFMSGYKMVFDREDLKLRWSNSNCKYLTGSEGMPLNLVVDRVIQSRQQSSRKRQVDTQLLQLLPEGLPQNPLSASAHHLSLHLSNF